MFEINERPFRAVDLEDEEPEVRDGRSWENYISHFPQKSGRNSTSIFGTTIIPSGSFSCIESISSEWLALEIAKYEMFEKFLIVGINSSIVYLFAGGFVRWVGKSRKILCCLCFPSKVSNFIKISLNIYLYIYER